MLRVYIVSIAMVVGIGAHAGGPQAFTEEAVARGVVFTMAGYPQPFGYSGFGCAFADLDGDGDQDMLILAAPDGSMGVFENDGTGHFTDRSADTGIAPFAEPSALALADYDADGDLDIYVTQVDAPNVMLRNDGGLVFADVTIVSGLGDAGVAQGAAWGDLDGDGLPEVYVPNYTNGVMQNPLRNALFKNLGGGTFVDVAPAYGCDHEGYGFQAQWFDYDLDGDADLYLSNDRGHLVGLPNQLWRNDDGAMVNVSEESGADVGLFSMGVACGDFDGNGYPDLYCTNIPGGGGFDNPLLLNLGNGTFVEASFAAGVNNPWASWGSVFADFTNNGWQDLYVNNMFDPNTLFLNSGTFPCIEAGVALGVQANNGVSYTAAVADIDNDGDMDLLVNNLSNQVQLFINHSSNTGNWTRFDVIGEGANTFAIGARVEIRMGERWQSREIYAGGNGFLGQNDLRPHFGLDDAAVIDEVRAFWPGGAIVRSALDLPANQSYVLDPQLTADFDLSGAVDVIDLLQVLAAWGPCASCPTDLDGDGVVGINDLLTLLAQWG